jgi:hypothetical protein
LQMPVTRSGRRLGGVARNDLVAWISRLDAVIPVLVVS